MQGSFHPTRGAIVSTLLILAVLLGLGAWQVQRLAWKSALLAQIESRMQQPPVPLPEKIDDPAAWEYRRVTLAGSFLYKHEFLIKPRTLDGASGYHMLVPFRRASGGVVLVNRGWISDALMPAALRPEGVVLVEGIVQLPHPTSFTPPNAPEKNDWYGADIPAMAAAAKLENAAPVIVNVAKRDPGAYPAGGKVEANISNNHRQYAVFWFVMALVSQIIFFIRSWKPSSARG